VYSAADVKVALAKVQEVPIVYLRTRRGRLPPISSLQSTDLARLKKINDRCKFN
jgi:hypothetical protein